eukprot:scaffold87_cov388-Prasinococcus_capsulatus_cf.AAC.21
MLLAIAEWRWLTSRTIAEKEEQLPATMMWLHEPGLFVADTGVRVGDTARPDARRTDVLAGEPA